MYIYIYIHTYIHICNEFLVSKETVVLRRWERSKQYIYIYIADSNCARSLVLWFEHCGMTEMLPHAWLSAKRNEIVTSFGLLVTRKWKNILNLDTDNNSILVQKMI